jgi:hypothetical protein
MAESNPIPLEGQLSCWTDPFDLPELLFAVSETGKTGGLVVRAGDAEKELFLHDGNVVFASSSSPDDRLGTYLLQRDQISLHDLLRLSQQVRPGVRLGTLLVQHGLLPSDELRRAVHGHVQSIVLSVFGWTEVSYAFHEEPSAKQEAILLTTPIPRLIVDGVERVASWARVTRALGSMDEPFRIVDGNEGALRSADLDTATLELLAMMRHPKSVREVCEGSEMPDIAVCRKLWAFRVLGWVGPAQDVSAVDLDLEGLGMILGDQGGH